MSTHKHIDKICYAAIALALIVMLFFVNADKFGIQAASKVMGYETTLFDTSTVHTINIEMDDWDDFIENCTSEEYYECSLSVDGETYKNVAIRAKGNTSLSQVASFGNDRYSFKIEFDHYDSTTTYHGLDKLCLNNIIQDNTYMKDYLVYQMMNEMGVSSPLCSYVYITVNGEDWGLYLAVEAVEESFLQRNYGSDYGELYKPDSSEMGGGRGNGAGFDMDEFMEDNDASEATDGNVSNFDVSEFMNSDTSQEESDGNQTADSNVSESETISEGSSDTNTAEAEDSNNSSDTERQALPEMPNRGNESSNDNTQISESNSQSTDTSGETIDGDTQAPDMPDEMPSGESERPDMDGQQMPGNVGNDQGTDAGRRNSPGNGGGMTNGSDDVLLKYIDDDPDSYSNIFDNAKTDITDSDKTRLINALKNLSSGEDLEDTVDVESVIRYFVVHNFVLNFDSYTGSMIHNYYLYEDDGQLQMIPWDYNLAFGGFESSSSAETLVNYPIDSPVSGGDTEDRPMIAWIFENEEYTELYHEYFAEFISEYFDSGYFEEMIDSVEEMISPYVEKDPTKFCTYEEFQTGVSTLKEFCLLRAESVSGQLDGTIGSTSDTQESSTLIDAGDIQISDMGSMNNGGGNGFGNDAGMGGGNPSGSENTPGEGQAPEGGGNAPGGGTEFGGDMPSGMPPDMPGDAV